MVRCCQQISIQTFNTIDDVVAAAAAAASAASFHLANYSETEKCLLEADG